MTSDSGRVRARGEAGRLADFMTVDLDDLTLAGWTHESLLDAIVFGAGNAVVREVCVGGKWV